MDADVCCVAGVAANDHDVHPCRGVLQQAELVSGGLMAQNGGRLEPEDGSHRALAAVHRVRSDAKHATPHRQQQLSFDPSAHGAGGEPAGMELGCGDHLPLAGRNPSRRRVARTIKIHTAAREPDARSCVVRALPASMLTAFDRRRASSAVRLFEVTALGLHAGNMAPHQPKRGGSAPNPTVLSHTRGSGGTPVAAAVTVRPRR